MWLALPGEGAVGPMSRRGAGLGGVVLVLLAAVVQATPPGAPQTDGVFAQPENPSFGMIQQPSVTGDEVFLRTHKPPFHHWVAGLTPTKPINTPNTLTLIHCRG